MERYIFKALTPEGNIIIKRNVEATGEQELVEEQKKKGNEIIYIRKIAAKTGVKELSPRELAAFSHELSVMLASGLNPVRALAIMSSQTSVRYKRLNEVCNSVADLLSKGYSFSEACRQQGGAFPPLIINALYSGEESGNMPLVARRMSDYYDKVIRVNQKIKGATTYPKVLLIMSIGIIIAMFAFILPQFINSGLFEGMELPAITNFMIALSDYVIENYIYIIVIGSAVFISFKYILGTALFRGFYDRFKIKAPLIGGLVQSICTSRFASTLSYLHNSGIMLTQAVYIAANATNNSYIINQMDEGAKKMQQGEMLSSILGRIDGFNSRIVHVALIGEETGELGDVLEKMAFSFDEETDAAVSRMLTLLTPAILVVMAGIVGSVVFAVMMPIMTLYQGM